MVEGARLESVYRSKAYRGFESRPLRKQKLKAPRRGFFVSDLPMHACLQKAGLKQKRERSEALVFASISPIVSGFSECKTAIDAEGINPLVISINISVFETDVSGCSAAR